VRTGIEATTQEVAEVRPVEAAYARGGLLLRSDADAKNISVAT
jgi:hypothetical protein